MLISQNFVQNMLKESSKKLNECTNLKRIEISILAIVTGGNVNAKEAFFCLRKMKDKGYYITLLATPSAIKIYGYDTILKQSNADKIISDDNIILAQKLIKTHSQVVIPILTSNSAGKIATGTWDTLATYLVYLALVEGKKVVAAKDSVYPSNMKDCKISPIIRLIEKNIDSLKELGVNLVELSDLNDNYPELKNEIISNCLISENENNNEHKNNNGHKFNKKIITKDDIMDLKDKVKTLIIDKNTIITPFAKEYCRDKGIEVNRCN